MKNGVKIAGDLGVNKYNLLKEDKKKYLVASMLAGSYITIGGMIIMILSGVLNEEHQHMVKIVNGITFSVALSLVVMAGGELFTGNNMIMAISSFEKKVTWVQAIKVWIFSFLGNFMGAIIFSILFIKSGIISEATKESYISTALMKVNAPIDELFIRGILCNMLVCLGVWCSVKMKEEGAKLIMCVWCIFAFVVPGFEHCVANMGILTTAAVLSNLEVISIIDIIRNMVPVTLGNILGGAFIIGAAYWYIGHSKKVIEIHGNMEINKE